MQVRVTTFKAEGFDKFPQSPFNDNTFIFQTIHTTFKDLPQIFAFEYHLNRCYNIETGTRLQRTKRALKDYLCNDIDYVVLDIDDVFDVNNVEKIIEILKKDDYYFFLMPSRSYGKEYGKYNLKGAIKVTGSNNEQGIIKLLKTIDDKINGYGKVDLSVSREATFQAPVLKNEVLVFHRGKNIPTIETIEKKSLHLPDASFILFESIEYLKTLGFTPVQDKGDLIVFEHPNEKTKRGYFMFKNNPFILHHFDKSKSKNIYKALLEYNPKLKEKIRRENVLKAEKEIEKYFNSTLPNPIYVNKKFLDKDVYIQLDRQKNLLIQSPMGTAKSKIIFEYLKEFPNEKVLFISNRRSLAKDMAQKYGVKLYLEDEWFPGDNLVVQFDSLHKYDLKYFDTIIIDEYVSTLLHSLSNLNDNFIVSKLKLFKALTGNFKVILLDAFLNIAPLFDSEGKNFKNFLVTTTSVSTGQNNESPTSVTTKQVEGSNISQKHTSISTEQVNSKIKNFCSLINTYREEVKLYEYRNEMKIIQEILNEKDKFTLSISNRQLAETIYEILKSKGRKVVFLNSHTTEEEKKVIYESFQKSNVAWDCLIYTPTLTVGVSILADDVKKHFHIDEGNIDVISSLQMIKRNRKAQEIHFYVREIKRNLIIDKELLKDFYLQNASEGPIFSYDSYGNLQLNEFGNFVLELQVFYNQLELNHYKTFKKLLGMQFKTDIILISDVCKLNLVEWKRKVKEKREKQLNKFIEKFLKDDLLYKSEEEKIVYLQNLFKTDDKEIIALALKHEKDIPKLKLHSLFRRTKQFLEKYYKELVAEGHNYDYIRKVQTLLYWKTQFKELKQRYTQKDIKMYGDSFKNFLKMIGYKWKYNSYYFDDELKLLLDKLK